MSKFEIGDIVDVAEGATFRIHDGRIYSGGSGKSGLRVEDVGEDGRLTLVHPDDVDEGIYVVSPRFCTPHTGYSGGPTGAHRLHELLKGEGVSVTDLQNRADYPWFCFVDPDNGELYGVSVESFTRTREGK